VVVSFDVAASSYHRFMGRFAEPLADLFVDWVGIPPTHQVLDVGCGTGTLSDRLVKRVGLSRVCAVDPSKPFVAAAKERLPGLRVEEGVAELLPYPGHTFDVALAQLVVHFMTDPGAGIGEMARVTRPGGRVAACVWDGGRGPLGPFWAAAHEIDAGVRDEADLPGAREGSLPRLFSTAGLVDVRSGALTVRLRCASFEEWWEPFTLGVGPAGDYVARLAPPVRERLRSRCAARFPSGPFEARGVAWTAVGTVR
jgi:SAM-dependent methyltransferase